MSARRHVMFVGLLLVASSFAVAAWLYPQLPDPVPTHWNARGVPDGFTPKPWGALLMPLVMLAVWLLFLVLPRIAPRGYELDRFGRVYAVLTLAVLGFLGAVTVLTLLVAAGSPLELGALVHAGVGLLFVVLGNYMGKLTRNFFVGIRTPWTLASEEVWSRTHRFGGRVFVGAGALLFLGATAGWQQGYQFAVIGVAALLPIAYSYVAYRRLDRST